MPLTKVKQYEELISKVNQCRLCPRMEGRKRVLTEKNGDTNSKVMFIAEAPGVHGAEKTGVPLCGDASGYAFEYLLETAGWEREEVFITNAVLCNPQNALGRNERPSEKEMENCSDHLKRTIDIINPRVIVTLGGTALSSLNRIENHSLTLARSVAVPQRWYNRYLFPLYHTSPKTLVHRPFRSQKNDFLTLKKFLEKELKDEDSRV